jgi:hypothetical protein
MWEKPCTKCGSHRVVEIEINTDNPEATQHSYFTCADCGEGR